MVLQIRLLEQARAGVALRSWQAGAVQFTAKICGLVGRATMADPLSGGGAFSSLSARCVLIRTIRDCSIATGADSKIARQEQGESTWDPLNASELAPNSANGLIPSLIAWAKSQPPGNVAMPLRGAHRQFVVDLSVFCRRGLCPPLGIAGRSRLLQDCPAGATFPGAVPEKRRNFLEFVFDRFWKSRNNKVGVTFAIPDPLMSRESSDPWTGSSPFSV